MMRVFVTGGTGFVGREVIRALQAHGVLVRCLVRPGSEGDLRGFEAIDRVPGDVLVTKGIAESIQGCRAVIHLVGIIREHPASGVVFERLHTQATANMVAAAQEAGVHRYLQMSALGVRREARSRYHRTKWEAEECVRRSGLDWTIFRPSVIYGRGDGSISVLAAMIRRLPVMPVLGAGRYRLQPVAVEQVAEGFARALERPATIGKTYEVGGPQSYAFTEILDQIGLALGKARVRKLHQPMALMRPLVRLLEPFPFFPITSDQLIMLEENSVCDPSPFYGDFDLPPIPFPDGLRALFS